MKQYIILRTDLNMRKGKMIAMGCHASNKILLDNILKNPFKWYLRSVWLKIFKRRIFEDDISKWLNGSFTKIVLGIPKQYSKQENILDYLYEYSQNNGYLSSLIIDNGATEFNGIKTKTCVCIGPLDEMDEKNKDINFILKDFKLL